VRVESVTSAQNRKVKTLLALQEKARLRKEMGLFVVEGRRELEHCVRAGFEIDTLFYCPEVLGLAVGPSSAICYSALTRHADPFRANADESPQPNLEHTAKEEFGALETILKKAGQIIEVPRELYEKVAYRGGTEGMIAEVKVRDRKLGDLEMRKNPLVVVLERVEKPGNLGAVLRSADAAGVDAVLICDPLTDLFNPNLIRASIGAVFTVPVVCCGSQEAIGWLKENNIKIYTAQLQDSSWYYDTDMRGGTAIVVGTEATGLTDAWRKAADAHIRIPMLGELDSLNASVSAAILLFEAVRQRNV
jgi:TrmH family RNA methyltransferase